MRMPTRLHITWENPTTLKIETDAGLQTRRLLFTRSAEPGARSLQGNSVAEWERPGGGRGAPAGRGGAAPPGGTLKVSRRPDGTTVLTGPAEIVAQGELEWLTP